MASLYVHIPFCERKCIYCDFYSIETLSPIEKFIGALHHEIDLYAAYGKKETFATIFFGGGTPSLLTPLQLEEILSHLHSTFVIDPDAEVTLETNPGTVTLEKLTAYRSLGVNRLSIGVQSFHEDELKFLSRIHNSTEAVRCVEYARRAGFENINVDLIYALPGQTIAGWADNLKRATELDPNHISAYGLIVENGTPLAHMVRSGIVHPTPQDEEADFYEFTMGFLAGQGFEHYEVSNYAQPGFRSRHNFSYWCHANYLGFGPSAHSFWKDSLAPSGRRWHNIAHLSHYCELLQEDRFPFVSEELLSREDLMTERIFLSLRSDGLDLSRFRRDFDDEFIHSREGTIQDLLRSKCILFDDDSLRLTPKGYLVCDEICARLIT